MPDLERHVPFRLAMPRGGLHFPSERSVVRILVLSSLYPPHLPDAANFRAEALTKSLRLRGHQIRVLTSLHGMKSEQRGGEVERRFLLNGILDHPLVTRISELKRIESHNHRVLAEMLASFQPDLIHVHSLDGLSKSLLFALRNSRLPTVYDVADSWLVEGIRNDPWLRWWNRPRTSFFQGMHRRLLEMSRARNRLDATAPTRMRAGYERVPDVYGDAADLAQVEPGSVGAFRFDRLYFCSQALKEEAEQAGFRVGHGEVIYPSISTETYVGEAMSSGQKVTKFLVVANLEPGSGVLTAVKALACVLKHGGEASLSIYGRGKSNYIAEIRSLIVTNQLPVEFLTVTKTEQGLPAIFRSHHALLYTSERPEPYSLTPLRAMARGIPVIGTAIGGVRELLREEGNAFIYTPGQAEELAARMMELQLQPVLCREVVERAQEEVLSQYNDVVIADRIENYLETSRLHWHQMSG